ncbi:GNAT family N-acetyltransferase [Paracoccus rhizosphaerae]|uniref:GNAT family N-acetyltransferase n=1 Tax=Paracoccus rhizosphaerae TaxID=1133347 RepID=A0ABV6CGJ3_9RHOB|nr:GNAT family N-acetyltransferase [Paracoccus rhizosphaerae]
MPTFRRATADDLPGIVAMLADDALGAARETNDIAPYRQAFAAIDADPNQFLCVLEEEGRVIGTMQLTFIAGLSRRGARRGQIEGVRVHRDHRGGGLGRQMILWAIDRCRAEGCALVQLTTDRSRTDAHRFYDSLGFKASHLGYKLPLD